MKPLEIAPGIFLTRQLARGATSSVYEARVEEPVDYAPLGTRLAVKVFSDAPVGHARLRFRRELEIGQALSSPHLAAHLDHGEAVTQFGPHPFIVMEYIDGLTLDEFVRTNPLPPEQRGEAIVTILLDVIRALRVLHDGGIVHRDLQPGNIKVTPRGRGVLLDFGTSKHLQSSSASFTWEELGTRRYWAPENLDTRVDRYQKASDIYMLASCFLHVLTGKFPFSVARNYPAFYDELRTFLASDGRVPELDDLPGWLNEHHRALLEVMLAPRYRDRPSTHELLQMAAGTLPNIATLEGESGFPLSEALWGLGGEEALATVRALVGDRAREGENAVSFYELWPEVLAGRETIIGFVKLLCYYRLIEQIDLTRPFYVQRSELGDMVNPKGYMLSEEELFRPAANARVVVEAVDRNPAIWEEIKAGVRRTMEAMAKGEVRVRCYGGFDLVTHGGSHWLVRPGNHRRWNYWAAVQANLSPHVVLKEVPFSPGRSNPPIE